MHQKRILVIAGSDPSGGAGIQADIKTITALGFYASAAITALTAQNTKGVSGILAVPPEFVRQQINLVLDDIGADCIKTGMLHNAQVIEVVAEACAAYKNAALVVDPVMVATSGHPLAEEDSFLSALQNILIPMATLVTANIYEAEILSGININRKEDMISAGEKIISMGAKNVLVKGGHMEGDTVQDILISCDGMIARIYEHARIYTNHTHGTGCTLASAIACGLAAGESLESSIIEARKYVHQAIGHAPGLGAGCGPLNHCWNIS